MEDKTSLTLEFKKWVLIKGSEMEKSLQPGFKTTTSCRRPASG